MEDKTRVDVKINGKEYTVMASAPIEYIYKIASYVDSKMNEIAGSNSRLSTAMTAVLTSINLADEVHKLRSDLELLRKENDALKASLQQTRPKGQSSNQNPPAFGNQNR